MKSRTALAPERKAATAPSTQARDEEEEIESRRPPNAQIVYETILREGEEEMGRPFSSLAFSGLAAGLSMSFSLIASAAIFAHLPAGPAKMLIVPLGYTFGFVIVILGRQQLFTENTLTPILPLLVKPSLMQAARVLRLWAIVLASNIVGAAIAALIIAKSAAFEPAMHDALASVVLGSCCGDGWSTFVRAIFAGWIIALMVWLLPAADQTRLWIIMLLTWLVSAAGFNHIIAGSVEMLYAVFRGMTSWTFFWGSFFVPTLLGNIVGGLVLVAALNYGQIVAERATQGAPGLRSKRRARPAG
jgi:formate/nitrite transporter FocA (FNT family)